MSETPRPAPRVSPRWFLLACAALLINAYGVWKLTRSATPTPSDARPGTPPAGVMDPGVKPPLTGRVTVAWNFDRPMVEASLTAAWSSNRFVRVEPETAGEIQWENPRRLVFRPHADWRPCNRFQFTAAADLADPAGQRPTNPILGEVESEPFRLTGFSQISYDPSERLALLQATFNSRPDERQLSAILTAATTDNNSLYMENLALAAGNSVRFSVRPRDGKEVTLALKPGSVGTSGPLPSVADKPLRVTLRGIMAVDSIRPVLEGMDQPFVQLELSNPADPEKAASFIEVSPALPFTMDATSDWRGGCILRVRGDFKPGAAYTVRALAGLPALNGARLEKEIFRTVTIPNHPAQIAFADEGRYLSTQGRRTLRLRGVNITNAYATVRQVYDNNLLVLSMREGDRYSSDYGSPVRGLMGPARTLKINPGLSPNQPGVFALDLSSVVTNNLRGVFQVSVSSHPERLENTGRYYYDNDDDITAGPVARLVVVSDLGLSVKRTPAGVMAWVNSLQTGLAVTGATVRVASISNQELGSAVTGPDGVATLALDPAADATAEAFVVTAATHDDLTFIALDSNRTRAAIPGAQGGDPYLRKGYEAFLYSDRGVYRPGETAHLRAVVRDAARGAPEPFPMKVELVAPDGRDIAGGTLMTSALGTAEFSHLFKPDSPLGVYQIRVFVPGSVEPIGQLSVNHEEFVPPQIVAKITPLPARIALGDSIEIRTTAMHLFGAPAGGASLRRGYTLKAEGFSHPNWKGHAFGDPERNFPSIYFAAEEAQLNSEGVDAFQRTIERPRTLPPTALRAVFESTVLESSGRGVSAYASVVVDPVSSYLGVKPAPGSWRVKVPGAIEVAAVKPDGTLADIGPVKATLFRADWNTVLERADRGYSYVSKVSRKEVWSKPVTLSSGKGQLEFAVEIAGSYELLVESQENAATRVSFYASSALGGETDQAMTRMDRVELTADAAQAAPGATVRLTAKAPFKGRALVTLETDRVLFHTVVEMTGNTFEIPVQIPEISDSMVHAVVSVIRPLKAGDLPGTHRVAGALSLPVVRAAEKTELILSAPEILRPQTPLEVTVHAPGLAGQPAEVTIAVVDEAICMLTEFKTPDILRWMERPRSLEVALFDAYNFLLPEITDEILGRGAKVGGDGDEGLRRRLNPVDARRFRPVALWSGTLPVGPDGTVKAVLPVPEFTGKLRIMAVACGARRYGSAERHVTVRRPLVVTPNLPRFAAPGDVFETSVRLHNLSGAPVRVKWSVAASGPLAVRGDAAGEVELAKDASATLRVPVAAGPGIGVGRLTVTAGEGELRYEETIELAVRPARASVVESGAFAVGPGETKALEWPVGFAPGGVEDRLSVAGLPALSLGNALESLFRYPYGCLEQTTSTAFPLLYLVDLAELTDPGKRSRETCAHQVQFGIQRILSMQLSSGWCALWPDSRTPYPYGTAYAAHFLIEAGKAGYEVPAQPLKEMLNALQSGLASWDSRSAREDQDAAQKAYALYVLALGGQWNEGWSARLSEIANLPVSARILNAASRAVAGRRDEAAKLLAEIGPAALASTTPRALGGSLDSPVKDLSLLLSAWLEVDPSNAAVVDIARRLEATQRGGRGWYTTHDNALALMALGKFAARVAADAKPFDATVTVGGAAHPASNAKAFTLRQQGPAENAGIVNQGPGTAYVSWMRAGTPAAGVESDSSTGVQVTREWLDIQGNPLGAKALRRGDLVLVRVTLDALGGSLDQVAVEDLLPAGLEVENPVFSTSAQVPLARELSKGELARVEHRDDRVLAFTGAFRGQIVFCYVARAVTPGEFVLPAITAECMYDPSIRAARGAGKVRVEARD